MKSSILFTFMVILCVTLTGCDGCKKEIDRFLTENMVDIPKSDNTPPTVWFEVTDSRTGEMLKVETDTEINKAQGTHLDIVLWGKDEDGGVKKLCSMHSFYTKCCTTNHNPRLCSISQPLIVPQCLDFSRFTTRAFTSWFMLSEISLSNLCSSDMELESGSISQTGTVENYHGGTASVTLVVRAVD